MLKKRSDMHQRGGLEQRSPQGGSSGSQRHMGGGERQPSLPTVFRNFVEGEAMNPTSTHIRG